MLGCDFDLEKGNFFHHVIFSANTPTAKLVKMKLRVLMQREKKVKKRREPKLLLLKKRLFETNSTLAKGRHRHLTIPTG